MWHSMDVIRANKTTRAIAAANKADLIAEILIIVCCFRLLLSFATFKCILVSRLSWQVSLLN